jgi:DNA-binding response OmpR family regulator
MAPRLVRWAGIWVADSIASVPDTERRGQLDRRRVARGGLRPYDRPGRYPPLLVVDSYEGARRPCARYLQRLSFDVSEASNGEEALAKIQKSPPRLILAEWTLPVLSTLTNEVPVILIANTEDPSLRPRVVEVPTLTNKVPVILSANTEDPSPRPRVVEVAGILRKPFTLPQMIAEIRRVLREKYPFPTA